MVSFAKASSVLFLASALSAHVASGHRLPEDFDAEKFAVKLKQLRAEQRTKVGMPNGGNGGGTGSKAAGTTAETFLDDHEFVPAVRGQDDRGPCPFINVMANHGFINRNGRNIPVFNIPALAPILFDFPEEMFTRPANQAIFDGQVEITSSGEALLDIVRLWDRPGEERDISQVFPNPGIIITEKFEVNLDDPNAEFPDNQDAFIDFRYTVDHELLQQLVATSADGVTITQENHNQHLHHRLQESLSGDEFFRFSEDDAIITANQYVLPCIILGEDVEDFSFCPLSSIEGLWNDFRFPEGFAPRSVVFGDAFDPAHYMHLFTVFAETNLHDIEVALEEEKALKRSSKLRGAEAKVARGAAAKVAA